MHLLQNMHKLYSLRRLLVARNQERGRQEGGRQRPGRHRNGAVAAVASLAIIYEPVKRLKRRRTKVVILSVIDFLVFW